MVLKKLSVENFLTKEVFYDKSIRGEFSFMPEVHLLDCGRIVQIHLDRDHPQVKEIMEKAKEKKVLNRQYTHASSDDGVIRVTFNGEENVMISNGGKTNIDIIEFNFSPKDYSLEDFPNGKIAIFITLTFEEDIDNSKLRDDLKKIFKEEN